MKMGQALSIIEAMLPEEVAAPYRDQLTRLQDSAPPMSTTTVHAVLSQELGRGWRKQLVEFDDDPAAAASIGQVHRGRWADGREVAIKIQYPGAGEALMSDLRQLVARGPHLRRAGAGHRHQAADRRAAGPGGRGARLPPRGRRPAAVRRARSTTTPTSWCPHVVAHTDKVLVTEWMESTASLARLIAEGTQEERNHYGELYVRFLFAGPARAGMLHADPHPGNFRMLPDPRRVARRPRRPRLRRRGAAARAAPAARHRAACSGSRCTTTTTTCSTGCATRGSSSPTSGSTPTSCGPTWARSSSRRRSRRFQFSRDWMRVAVPAGPGPTPAGVDAGAAAQPAAVVPADPPRLGGRHRRAVASSRPSSRSGRCWRSRCPGSPTVRSGSPSRPGLDELDHRGAGSTTGSGSTTGERVDHRGAGSTTDGGSTTGVTTTRCRACSRSPAGARASSARRRPAAGRSRPRSSRSAASRCRRGASSGADRAAEVAGHRAWPERTPGAPSHAWDRREPDPRRGGCRGSGPRWCSAVQTDVALGYVAPGVGPRVRASEPGRGAPAGSTLGPAGQPAVHRQLATASQFVRLSQARGHLCTCQIFIHELHLVAPVRVSVHGWWWFPLSLSLAAGQTAAVRVTACGRG